MSFDNNQFDNMFLKEPGTPTGNVYDIYMYQRQKSYGSDIQINMNLGREAWRMQKKVLIGE
jgi:hypothetical protein